MRLAFVDFPGKKLQFFSQVACELEKHGATCRFFSLRANARGKTKQMGRRPCPPPLSCLLPPTEQPLSNEEIEVLAETERKLNAAKGKHPFGSQEIKRFSAVFSAFLQEEEIDVVLVWNGHFAPQAVAVTVARKLGLRTLFFENGYFSGTMQIDPVGVNFDSSLTSTLAEVLQGYHPSAREKENFDQYREAYLGGQLPHCAASPPKVKAPLSHKFLRFFEKRLQRTVSVKKGFSFDLQDPACLPEKFIYLPLQVHDDTQLLLHSPLFGNDFAALISCCLQQISENLPEFKLVVKPHPVDAGRFDYENLVQAFPEVCWVFNLASNDLLPFCSAVITVNSTVGFEALIHGKPVVMVGRNFYGLDQIVFKADACDAIGPLLVQAVNQGHDSELAYRMLCYLYNYGFTMGSHKNFSAASVSNVATRIFNILTNEK